MRLPAASGSSKVGNVVIQGCSSFPRAAGSLQCQQHASSWLSWAGTAELTLQSAEQPALAEGKGSKTSAAASAESAASGRAHTRAAPSPWRVLQPGKAGVKPRVWLGGQGHLAGLSLIPSGGDAGLAREGHREKGAKSSWVRSLQTAPWAAPRRTGHRTQQG